MPKDLVVLTADKSIEHAIRGLLSRPASLGIQPILPRTDIFVHPQRDPGCFQRSEEFLRPLAANYSHALVVFDRVGSGQELLSQEEISGRVRARLAISGWNDRGDAVVLDPELEVWVFAPSPHVERCLGWPARGPCLRDWLEERGMWASDQAKPADPKAALELARRHIRKPWSSAFFGQLAERVGIQGCVDPALTKFRITLQEWFPALEGE
jgi:hypothetical protein